MKTLSDDCEQFITFPPGHIYSSKQGSLRRWYNPPWFSEQIPSTPFDPMVLRIAFEKAVVKRLMTDVPFGVLLSGRLDSSLVAAVASRHLAESEGAYQWGSQLHFFCVGLKGLIILAGALLILLLVLRGEDPNVLIHSCVVLCFLSLIIGESGD